ncbi:MAG: ectoine/hydroxyectoine ABC transporter substrate-binding protein EhuB [Sciscionella sp.]
MLLSACTSTSSGGGGGGGGSLLDQLKKQGSINIGVAGEVPYGYIDNGKVTGEAPEVARAIFKKLGIDKVQAKQVSFKQLIPALNAKQFDMVCAGMDITAPRCKNAQFSIPDYSVPVSLLVPKGNPKNVVTFKDVIAKKVKIAVETGAVEKDYATKVGVPESQILTFGSPDDLLSAVTSKRAYAGVLTSISIQTLVKKNPSAPVEAAKGFKPVINGHAIAETGGFTFRKDESALVDAFNKQLKQLHESGEWLKIVTPFGFTKDNLPIPGLTTQKLCQAS